MASTDALHKPSAITAERGVSGTPRPQGVAAELEAVARAVDVPFAFTA